MKKSTKLFNMFFALVMAFPMLGTLSVSAVVWDDEGMTPDVLERHMQYMQVEGNKLVAYTGTSTRVVYVPFGVTEIGEGAFKNHTEIHRVIMFTCTSKIGKEAFKGCTNLEEVLGSGIAVIGDSAFEDCTKLFDYSFGIGNDVSVKPTSFSIGKAAFKGCINLRGFGSYSPNWELKAETFANCPKLKFVNFNVNPTKIDPAAFSTITNNGKTVTRSSNPVIHSQTGTVAQTFANKYGMRFSTEQPAYQNIYVILEEEYAVPQRPTSIFSHTVPNPKYNPKLYELNPSLTQYGEKYIPESTERKINYYVMRNYTYTVLRDVAAECNKLDATKFNIEYMPKQKALNIVFGANYVANGSEYKGYDKYAYVPNNTVTKMPLYFNGHASNLFAYNIGSKACVILKDLLQEMNSPYEINENPDKYNDVGKTWLKLDDNAFNQVNQK